MKLILTNHARKRMSERGISLNKIKEIMNFIKIITVIEK